MSGSKGQKHGKEKSMLQNLFKLSSPAVKAAYALSNIRAFIYTGCLLSSLAKIPFLIVPLLTGSCLYECIAAFRKLNHGKQFAVDCCQPCTVLQKKKERERK